MLEEIDALALALLVFEARLIHGKLTTL